MRLESEQQVLNFVSSLAPDQRRALRLGLRALAAGRGDVKALKEEAAEYFRLRVKEYRIIFRYASRPGSGERWLHCVFAERRSVVYNAFAESLHQPGRPAAP